MGTTISGATGIDKVQTGAIETVDLPTGSVLQVINTFYVGTVASSSTTPADVTGFSAVITPSSTSSKILVNVSTYFGFDTGDPYPYILLLRNGTSIAVGTTTGGSNRVATFLSGANVSGNDSTTSQYKWIPASKMYLDSPSSTSELTYKIQFANGYTSGSSTAYLNRQGSADDNGYIQSPGSTITLMEIAG